MSFESKRLRVQIPCREESLIEAPRRFDGICRYFNTLPHTLCEAPSVACNFPSDIHCPEHSHFLACVQHQTGCLISHCRNWTSLPPLYVDCEQPSKPPCGVGTKPEPDDFRKWIEFEVDHENPGSVLFRPEDLPRLRAQLEAELENSERLQGEVRARLEELGSIEEQLENRASEDG